MKSLYLVVLLGVLCSAEPVSAIHRLLRHTSSDPISLEPLAKIASLRSPKQQTFHRTNHALPLSILSLRGGESVSEPPGGSSIDLTPQAIATYLAAAGLIAMTVGLVRNVPRSQGRAPAFVTAIIPNETLAAALFHSAYFFHCLAVVTFMPQGLKNIVFSKGSILLLGTVFPIVESIRAAATDVDGRGNTRVWLQYWIMHGIFHYSTEFVDKIADKYPKLQKHWFPLEFYMILHLILPFTDGAELIYQTLTRPYLVPLVKPIAAKCEGWLTSLALTIVNASHIWWFAAIFMALPAVLKRAAVVAVGTAFPLAGSIVAVSQTDNVVAAVSAAASEAASGSGYRWLTYWSCFSIVYLVMFGAEKMIGRFPGLYTAALSATLYLMLPMFDGAEKAFRRILVPLFRQSEALILKDARVLAGELLKKLPAERHEEARKMAAAAFLEQTTSS